MEIYINETLRSDIKIMSEGSLDQDSSHTTSSSITVEMPIKSTPVLECDAVRMVENDKTVFAGTVMKATQATFDNINLSFRQYTLDLSNNADLIATVQTTLQFPSGANISQLLFGNHPRANYYSSNLPEFYGILEVRVEPEGITIGTVDDFTFASLEEPANLWGMLVIDCLDSLAGIANAWWEITNDKVFNMRSAQTRTAAPANLDSGSDIFNVSVSRDALTLYSAVRVVGGQSKYTNMPTFNLKSNNGNPDEWINWERTSETILTSSLPLYSVQTVFQGNIPSQSTPSSSIPYQVNVGFKGIHDDDPNYKALMEYGGNTIEMKSGYKWIDLSQYTFPPYQIMIDNAIYLVDINLRLVDEQAAQSIQAQRGGTGIIEYILEDPNLTSLADAALEGESFLATNSRRASTVSFETFIPGWEVGQSFSANLEYYNLFDVLEVTKVSAQIIGEYSSGSRWKYSVEASSVPYSDPYKRLFNKQQKISFNLDSGFSPTDGSYANDQINIQTYVVAFASIPVTWRYIQRVSPSWTQFQENFPTWTAIQSPSDNYTWAEVQSLAPSWNAFESTFPTWATIQNIQGGWYFLGNYLTSLGRQKILNILSGNGETVDATALNAVGPAFVNAGTSSAMLSPEEVTPPSNNSITATYYMSPDEYINVIDSLQYLYNGSSSDPDFEQPFMEIPINIDKSATNPQGKFALTISVRHTII